MKKVFRLTFAVLIVTLCSTLTIAQQVYRQGDVFRGPVKTVRTERTFFRVVDDTEIESPPQLLQEVVYATDGLSRELRIFNPGGSLRQKTIETYRADGTPKTIQVVDGSDKTLSTRTFERDHSGLPVTETRYNGDGSVKEKKFIQSDPTVPSINAISTVAGDGRQLETSVSEVNSAAKIWRTTKPDGSRSEQIASRDSAGNRRTEFLSYAADGALVSKRISIVDPGVTRLEATEYDGAGNIRQKTLQTREYDSRRNLSKTVDYRWNNERQKFEPAASTYHRITYFDTTER